MRGKDRAALRAEAHHLDPAVHIGSQGVTDGVVQSLEDALRTRELVKVKIGKGNDTSARDLANELAEASAAEVVQVIGRTFTLYREKREAEQ